MSNELCFLFQVGSKAWPLILSLATWNPFVDQPASRFVLAEAAKIDVLEIHFCINDRNHSKCITAEAEIDQFLAFVGRLNSGWKTPWKACPSTLFWIVVQREGIPLANFQFSPTHIRGWNEGELVEPRFRDLSGEEWGVLKAILGITDDYQFSHSERGAFCEAPDTLVLNSEVQDEDASLPPETREIGAIERFPWERTATSSRMRISSIVAGGAALYAVLFLVTCGLVGILDDPSGLIFVAKIIYFPIIALVRLGPQLWANSPRPNRRFRV